MDPSGTAKRATRRFDAVLAAMEKAKKRERFCLPAPEGATEASLHGSPGATESADDKGKGQGQRQASMAVHPLQPPLSGFGGAKRKATATGRRCLQRLRRRARLQRLRRRERLWQWERLRRLWPRPRRRWQQQQQPGAICPRPPAWVGGAPRPPRVLEQLASLRLWFSSQREAALQEVGAVGSSWHRCSYSLPGPFMHTGGQH